MPRRITTVRFSLFVVILLGVDVAFAQLQRLPSVAESHFAIRLPESHLDLSSFEPFQRDDRVSQADKRNARFPAIHAGSESLDVQFLSHNDKLHRCDGGVASKAQSGSAADSSDSVRWSTTEVQFQYGKLDSPSFFSGQSSPTRIVTLQHASGWKYGDNFFFVDILDDGITDGFSDDDVYLEWYPNFSLGKILHRKIGCGMLADVGVIAGINYGADANVLKWLPGIRLSWELPGFAFFNTDFTAYIDDNAGLASGGAPAETDSFMIDFNWAFPFSIGDHDFSIEGHVEFIGARTNELGNDVSWWILGQPQFRYDLGKALFGSAKQLFVGIEWQLWPNKLGDRITDENAVQALAVWRL